MNATEQCLQDLIDRYKAAGDEDRIAIEAEMMEATEGLSEHPEWYDHACMCDLCKSYAD